MFDEEKLAQYPWIFQSLLALDKCTQIQGFTPFHIASSIGI
jgi:hypothetical protein